ncbi:helix-turn-helix transcriptional regulator [Streptomyces coacervatus]|uniref:Helix-turn-helix transcriptional regulator n=1 Tax=Streptomyces coacervatus TaxID=647381 RepID=A0ABP7IG96_9ACTN|nr:helix-turn-helix transcriptional regulator [Streptomyces coacervatus]MDF2271775.1 helix-turn-helix transcriptional regulator [Streptomyces coacervatus]
MNENTESTTREALADFLRRRRDALSPEVVGLQSGQRRRTPGLRRDEVARLANMSTTYYERLEQGRGPQPSAAILAGLASALRLAPDARAYLYLLAGRNEPTAENPDDVVDPELFSVMRAVEATCPAFVTDDLGTLVAQNELHTTLFGHLVGLPGWEGNLFWHWFCSGDGWRQLALNSAEQQEAMGHNYVAHLRLILAERGYDPAAAELVAELRGTSAEFSRMWDEHHVARAAAAIVSVLDDRVGRLDFKYSLMLGTRSRQRLFTFHAVPGTLTQQRLAGLLYVPGDAVSTHR